LDYRVDARAILILKSGLVKPLAAGRIHSAQGSRPGRVTTTRIVSRRLEVFSDTRDWLPAALLQRLETWFCRQECRLRH
jgi:hypothetical protein